MRHVRVAALAIVLIATLNPLPQEAYAVRVFPQRCKTLVSRLSTQPVDLRKCRFEGRLRNRNFKYALLQGATFDNADLTQANFTGAVMTNVTFTNSVLTGAVFNSAIGSNVLFEGSN